MGVKILSVETSTDSCSVALLIGEKVYVRHQVAPQEHSKLILHMLDELLLEANCALESVDAFSFGVGPGSFTGLRIASAVVQGLAFATHKSVVPISTLQALAQSVYKKFGYTEVFAALDARMKQVYYGFYKLDSKGIMQPCMEEGLAFPGELKSLPAKYKTQVWHGVGSGVVAYHKELENSMPYIMLESTTLYPSALEVAGLAKSVFAEKGGIKPAEALPVYIRNEVTHSQQKTKG